MDNVRYFSLSLSLPPLSLSLCIYVTRKLVLIDRLQILTNKLTETEMQFLLQCPVDNRLTSRKIDKTWTKTISFPFLTIFPLTYDQHFEDVFSLRSAE